MTVWVMFIPIPKKKKKGFGIKSVLIAGEKQKKKRLKLRLNGIVRRAFALLTIYHHLNEDGNDSNDPYSAGASSTISRLSSDIVFGWLVSTSRPVVK